MNKKVITSLLAASMLLAGCNVCPPAIAVASSKPTATKSLTITVGGEKSIKVKGANIISRKFKSTNKKIATVSKKGVVTAKEAGKCNVKVTIKYKKTKKAKKILTQKLFCKVTVNKAKVKATKKPKATTTPKITVTPGVTATPEATVTPGATVTPEATVTPGATATLEATVAPGVTVTPEATVTPGATATLEAIATPEATITLGATSAPEMTITPEVTTMPVETNVPEPTDSPNAIYYTKISTVEQLPNVSWTTVLAPLSSPIVFSPGDRVEIALSAKDVNGNDITDLEVQVMFSTEDEEGDAWNNRIGIQGGQNPANIDEWKWVRTDNRKVELWNTLDNQKLARSLYIQTSTPSRSLGEDDFVTVTVERIIITPPEILPKNADDVAALKKIIEEQTALGATVSANLDNGEQYGWRYDGRLSYINWDGCDLKGELSLSPFTALTRLRCGRDIFDPDKTNQLTSLDVNDNTALTELICDDNQLTNLDVSNNKKLTELFCANNQLSSLDVSNNIVLRHLSCSYNQLTELDVRNNTLLKGLWCSQLPLPSSSKLTSLDVSNNKDLTELMCDNNQLSSLDVSNNIALEQLYCTGNPLTNLNVSNNKKLKVLMCLDNNLTSLDVSNNLALTNLGCDSNQLGTLDVSVNTALTYLGCNFNELTDLDVSNNINLETLYCYNNQLINLDVSKNIALKKLKCSENQLTSLDVSQNTALTTLECDDNVTVIRN